MSLSVGQLRTQVRSALTKARAKQRDAKRLGFYSPSGWSGPLEVEVDKAMWRIADARSPLAARELLATANQDERLLLICRVAEEELGGDLMARFGVPRLLRPNPIETLKDQFQSVSIDPRILSSLFLVDLLSEHTPEHGFPPAANGHLTAETFWGILLSRLLGIPSGTPDLIGLLRWTLDVTSGEKLRSASPDFREAAATWIEQSAGSAAGDILRSFADAGNPRPIVLGLTCGVLYDATVNREPSIAQARVRLERYLGHQGLAPDHAVQWAQASTAIMNAIATENPDLARALGRELDDLLGSLQAAGHASLSAWSQLGLDSRFDSFGRELQKFITSPSRGALGGLFRSADAIRASRLVAFQADRLVRAEMSVRLCSWLQAMNEGTSEAVASLPDAVERYLLDESFVDWARTTLYSSDPSPSMAEAIRKLLQAVAPHRNRSNELYAGLLSAWTPSQDAAGRVTPIHKVLSKIVAPAGDTAPVLLIVLDGMSAAVFDELVTDLGTHGWRSILPRGASRPLVLAGIPSITELSRTSLLSGKLQVGGQPEELAGFSEHSELRQRSRSGSPKLFHKGTLTSQSDGNLSEEVADAIVSTSRFVAVVINAIDDHLAKGEQIAVTWKGESIRPLSSLLARARDVGRLVILVSDHGHVLDHGTQQTTGSDSDRYRRPNPAPADGEVLINPTQAGLGLEAGGVVLAWSESLRYCGRKNGYHGGVSPQETVVPVAVLHHGSVQPEGWVESPVLPPAWWNGELQAQTVPSTVHVTKQSTVPTLFEVPVAETTVPAAQPSPQWLDRLLQTELFKAQRARAGRNVPSPEEVAKFIGLMLSRGGKLTRPALARAINMPELRVGGYVSQIRRILNVEGYPIVHVHEESSTVELNEPLLKAQFDVT